MFCSDEFKCSNFLFNGIDRSRFYIPIWTCIPRVFRWILQGFCALYTLTVSVVSLISYVNDDVTAYWFKYLTTWNYLLCTTYFLTAFIVNMKNGRNFTPIDTTSSIMGLANRATSYGTAIDIEESPEPSSVQQPTNGEEKLYWLLFGTSHVVYLVVVVIYWGFAVPPGYFDGDTSFIFYLKIDRHGIAYGLLVLEYIFTGIPFRILNFVYPLIFILLYSIFNLTYWVVTGEVVYAIFDWSNQPGKSIGFIFAVAAIAIIFKCLFFLVDVGKRKLSEISSCRF